MSLEVSRRPCSPPTPLQPLAVPRVMAGDALPLLPQQAVLKTFSVYSLCVLEV